MYEQKTFNTRKKKKPRIIKVSKDLKSIIDKCRSANVKKEDYIFAGRNKKPFSIQYVNSALKRLQKEYNIPLEHFSSHSLLKAGCLKIFENNGRSEAALILISKIRGHSNTGITTAYLGIDQQKFDDAYDSL